MKNITNISGINGAQPLTGTIPGAANSGKYAAEASAIVPDKAAEEKAAKEKEKEKEQAAALELSDQMKEMLKEQAESAKKAGEGMKDMAKIMEIARRISRGDHVPPNDEKKLMEYSSDLYQAAKMASVLNANKKHRKHKSLFDEDEDNGQDEKVRELRRESARAESSGGEQSAESPTESSSESSSESSTES